jgi:hypothetical protein
MLFMVIERFRPGQGAAVYQRVRERGRMLPESVRYVDSWVEMEFGRCFQVMQCERAEELEPWLAAWRDLVDFEVVPVVTSAEAARRMAEREDPR